MSSESLTAEKKEEGGLPQGWKKKKIGEIAEVVGGGTPSTKDPTNFGGSIPWITPKDLSGYGFKRISRGDRNITEKGLKSSGAKLLPKNTVLLSSRAPIGYVAIADVKLATNQGFRSLVLKDGYSSDFIYYLLKSKTDVLESYASGSTFKEISGSALKQIELALPPYEEQCRIGKILGCLDNKIELNHRINHTLKTIAEATFKSWFFDFEPYEEFKDSELGKIPKEFEVKKLKRVISLEYGKGLPEREREGSEYPVYGSNGKVGSHKDSLVEGPGIIIGRKGTIGTVTLSMDDFWPIDTTFYVKSKIEYDILFYYHLLKNTIEFGRLGSDSAVPGLNRNIALDQKVVFPPKEEVKGFVSLIRPLHYEMKELEEENQKLANLRDTLLPKLMSGEIRV